MRTRRVALGITAILAVFGATREARADDDLVLDLGGTTLELRRILKGQFLQGSPASEALHDKDEEGPRPVSISHDFWMGEVPVTRAQFAKFTNDTRYVTEAEKGGGWGWDGEPCQSQVMVHELAHACGWHHGDDKGVPGDDGEFRCK